MWKLPEQVDRHERQISAIRTLVREGKRMVVETRKDIRALNAVQKRTEQNLQTLIQTLTRGGNGHGRRRVDLQ